MRAENFWATPATGAGGKYLLVPITKNEKGKNQPRPEGMLDAQVFHPLKKRTGRAKGSGLEIKVAKALNDFYFKGEPVLRRTPLSGGWSDGLGDICCDPEQLRKNKVSPPPIYVECKAGQGISYGNLMDWAFEGSPTFYTGWLKEAKRQSQGRTVLLVVQGDGLVPWVIAVGKSVRHDLRLIEPSIQLTLTNAVLFPLRDLVARRSGAEERDGNAGNIESG